MDVLKKLLNGLSQIDRMRKDIDLVVSLVQSSHLGIEDMAVSNFKAHRGRWTVGAPAGTIYVEWTAYDSILDGPDRTILFYKEVPLAYVQAVHESLSVLVESMLDEFPELRKVWQPLFTAAEQEADI